MEVTKGKDRTVYRAGGFVYKLPNVDYELARDVLRDAYASGGLNCFFEMLGPASDYLDHGITANRLEAKLARNYPDVVVPTYSLGFGLVNIQPHVKEISVVGTVCMDTFARHIPDDVCRLGHMIEKPANFGMCSDGRVRFLDGGSKGLEIVLQCKRPQLVNALTELTSLVIDSSL